jgi:hypothetical protein
VKHEVKNAVDKDGAAACKCSERDASPVSVINIGGSPSLPKKQVQE